VVGGDKGDSSKGPSAGERLLAVDGLARALRLAAPATSRTRRPGGRSSARSTTTT
jgi:hypothetical protein